MEVGRGGGDGVEGGGPRHGQLFIRVLFLHGQFALEKILHALQSLSAHGYTLYFLNEKNKQRRGKGGGEFQNFNTEKLFYFLTKRWWH